MTSEQRSRIISVFGSHAPQPGSADYDMAREVGRLLGEAGFSVATGGYGGTMAAVSQGASEAGGHVVGVTSSQVEKSRPAKLNQWVIEEIQYETLSDRLMHLVKVNVGMIVLPGGIGTLSEFALAWSLMQVKEIRGCPLILIGPIWRDTIDALSRPEYIAQDHLALIKLVGTPAGALESLIETGMPYWRKLSNSPGDMRQSIT